MIDSAEAIDAAGALAELDGLLDRLTRAVEQLRSGDLSQAAAASLVEECVESASRASSELERRARAIAAPPIAPGQERLL